MILQQQGTVKHSHVNAVAGSVVEVDCYGYNSVMIIHEMTAPTTGAFVSVKCRHTQGTAGILHPAPAGNSEFGANVKAAVLATNYVSIYRGVSRFIDVELTRTDGTHNVRAIPINT